MRKWAASLGIFFLALAYLFAEDLTPEMLTGNIQKMYDGITDYQCRFSEWCTKGSQREERTINYYFKRPRWIRMDIIAGNNWLDIGSAGVYKNDGKVSGRKGGILGFLPLRVRLSSPLATTLRGSRFDQSDLYATLEKLYFHLSGSAVSLERLPNGLIQFSAIPRDPRLNDGFSKDVLIIDPATWLPQSSDSYEGDAVVQHAEWSHYICNAGLPDELFDVRWDAKRLAKSGIPSIHEVPVEMEKR